MKDYRKPCIRENNPDHVIIHVSNNELDFERKPKMIVKSIIDIAKKHKNTCPHSQYTLDIPTERQLNNEALDVNEVSKICR